jgi:hypothetical protein
VRKTEVTVVQTTPEWLTRHDGKLVPAWDGKSYLIMIGNKPDYQLAAIPLVGKFGCAVKETINGRRLDGGGAYPSLEEAIRGGLEDLRKALGW